MTNTTGEKVLLEATLVFLLRGKEVLLAIKTDKIGAGKWNGYGGGPEAGETILDAAVRELEEESGLKVKPENLEKKAIVNFHNTKINGEQFTCRVHVFITREWEGEIKETKEMIRPTWFPIDQLPLEELMPADPDWLPFIFTEDKIEADAFYGMKQSVKLAPTQIRVVTALAA